MVAEYGTEHDGDYQSFCICRAHYKCRQRAYQTPKISVMPKDSTLWFFVSRKLAQLHKGRWIIDSMPVQFQVLPIATAPGLQPGRRCFVLYIPNLQRESTRHMSDARAPRRIKEAQLWIQVESRACDDKQQPFRPHARALRFPTSISPS